MTTIRTNARVSSDGNLVIPIGVAEAGKRVRVTVEPEDVEGPDIKMTQEEWVKFVERTAGSISDPTFVRQPQPTVNPVAG